MRSPSRFTFFAPTFAMLATLSAGCGQEPTANAAIKSTSPAGTSTASASDSAARRDVALLRTVYAVPAGASVDVCADDNRIVDGPAYRTVTPSSRDCRSLFPPSAADYQAVDPYTGSLELKPDHQSGTMLSIPSVRLNTGKSHTLIVVGRVRTAPKLDTILVEDQAVPVS